MRHLGRHPNIISLKDLVVNAGEDELYVVMELMDTDLHRIIQSPQPLGDAHFKHFLFQLLRGLRFAHGYGVIHRDLKPANLLVTKNCDLCISDFGLARQMPERGPSLMTEVRARVCACVQGDVCSVAVLSPPLPAPTRSGLGVGHPAPPHAAARYGWSAPYTPIPTLLSASPSRRCSTSSL
jgi:serine/threonine protein kinase